MGNAVPKQFLLLKDKPILHHTIEAFHQFDANMDIILVLPAGQIQEWKRLCSSHTFAIRHTIVEGGNERFYSVQNAINQLNREYNLVAIHDGVRPLVSQKTISNCFRSAEKHDAVIPYIKPVETVRILNEQLGEAVLCNRSNVYLIQTPQVFKYNIIKIAYEQDFQTHFTDDASVVEHIGVQIHLVEGNLENIKITSPTDIIIAEAIINGKTQ